MYRREVLNLQDALGGLGGFIGFMMIFISMIMTPFLKDEIVHDAIAKHPLGDYLRLTDMNFKFQKCIQNMNPFSFLQCHLGSHTFKLKCDIF